MDLLLPIAMFVKRDHKTSLVETFMFDKTGYFHTSQTP
jgi:hypothetical protein